MSCSEPDSQDYYLLDFIHIPDIVNSSSMVKIDLSISVTETIISNNINQSCIIDLTRESSVILLLGTFYNNTESCPNRNQIMELEISGYDVYSIDNDNEKISNNRHCKTNIFQPRQMLIDMGNSWGSNLQFDLIIIDYAFTKVFFNFFFFKY
jgi:hypothetical protein